MRLKASPKAGACLLLFCVLAATVGRQAPAQNADAAVIAKRNEIEKELESVAIIDRKVMVPMRDGKRMATDIYRPKERPRSTRSSSCALLTTSISGMCGWERRAT